MDGAHEIGTARLRIWAGDAASLRASMLPVAEFAAAIGEPVAEDWPPLYWDAGAVEWICGKIERDPGELFWRPRFVQLIGGLVVGTVGFKGPPDEVGFVEIGYGVVTSHWRRGIASEAVAAMIGWASGRPGVRGLCAHTLTGDPASSGVLRKAGFVFVRTTDDPTDGRIDRFERGLVV